MKPVDADVVVLGLGVMGLSALEALARRNVSVMGIEQYRVGHDRGSSHGETRIIRQAYFEHPDYVPLLRSVYALWKRIEDESHQKLFEHSGLLLLGKKDSSPVLVGAKKSSEQYHIPIEVLNVAQIAERFPQFGVEAMTEGVLEPGAGYLRVAESLEVLKDLAVREGALIRESAQIEEVSCHGDGVEVHTAERTFRAKKLVVTAGAWIGRLFPELDSHFSIHKVMLHWFQRKETPITPQIVPCWGYDTAEGFIYGIPRSDHDWVKIGVHLPGELIGNPYFFNREPEETEVGFVELFVSRKLKMLQPTVMRSVACMYTMTRDGNFLIDTHPAHPHVHFAAGFSGHGFKFAPVVGEILADLAVDGETSHPVEFLRLARFLSKR